MSKAVLGFLAFSFVSYGLICLFIPSIPIELVGFDSISGDAKIELIAMYGGLQTAIGIFFLIAFFKEHYLKAALLCALIIMLGLVVPRTIAFLFTQVEATHYTLYAIIFECVLVVLSWFAFKKVDSYA